MFACNQASRIDCQFVEDIIYGVFAARSTGLRHLVDVARRIAAGSAKSGLWAPYAARSCRFRARGRCERAYRGCCQIVFADGVPKRPWAARKCEMLTPTLAKNSALARYVRKNLEGELAGRRQGCCCGASSPTRRSPSRRR